MSRSGDTYSLQDKGDVGDKVGGNTKCFGRMGGLFINFCELSWKLFCSLHAYLWNLQKNYPQNTYSMTSTEYVPSSWEEH